MKRSTHSYTAPYQEPLIQTCSWLNARQVLRLILSLNEPTRAPEMRTALEKERPRSRLAIRVALKKNSDDKKISMRNNSNRSSYLIRNDYSHL